MWLPMTLVSSLTWKSPSPASPVALLPAATSDKAVPPSPGTELARTVTRCPRHRWLPRAQNPPGIPPVTPRMKLTGHRRPEMPPGTAAIPRPRCRHPAANGFARVAPRPLGAASLGDVNHTQFLLSQALPRPRPQAWSPAVGCGRRWQCHHQPALPPTSTATIRDKPGRPRAPQRGLAPAQRPSSSCPLVPLSPPHPAWGKRWGPGPPAQGHLATVRKGGENLCAGWRPPLTAC